MPPLSSLKIVFAGSGEFALPTLRALQAAGASIQLVVTQPDRPTGRGRKLASTAVGALALEKGLPLLRTDNINAEVLPDSDVMVVIAFGQKIASTPADRPRLGSVNLHASRLPLYRGAAPINWAILNGEASTGNSVIRLAQRMDAGDILGRSLLPIGPMETAGELHDRLAIDGAELMVQVLGALAEGTSQQWQQDESSATSAPKLSRETSKIDWNRSAAEISNQIRGLFPWPGCRVRLVDVAGQELNRFTLVRARAHAAPPVAAPGCLTNDGLVCAADGLLEIVELQPQGGRPMGLDAYRNGHAWPATGRLESWI